MSDYSIINGELYHHGVKGMKWGVRKKYRNTDGSLNSNGIEKYAKKGHAKDALNSNKSIVGKTYDRYSGAHKIRGEIEYNKSSKAQNKVKAEQYLKERKQSRKETTVKVVAKGASAVSKMALMSATDDIFYGGAGKKALKAAGRKTVEAYMKARGRTVLGWVD